MAVPQTRAIQTSSGRKLDIPPSEAEKMFGITVKPYDQTFTSPAVVRDVGVYHPWRDLRRDFPSPVARQVAIHKGWGDLWAALPYFEDFTVLSVPYDLPIGAFNAQQQAARIPGAPDFDAMQADTKRWAFMNQAWPFARYTCWWGRQERLGPIANDELNWNAFGAIVPNRIYGSLLKSVLEGSPIKWKDFPGNQLRYAMGANGFKNGQWQHTFHTWNSKANAYVIGQIESPAELDKLLALPVAVMFYVQKKHAKKQPKVDGDIDLVVTVVVRVSEPYKAGVEDALENRCKEVSDILINGERMVGANVRWAFLSMVPGAPPLPTHIIMWHHNSVQKRRKEILVQLMKRNSAAFEPGNIAVGHDLETGQLVLLNLRDRESGAVKGSSGDGKTTWFLIPFFQMAGQYALIIHSTPAKAEAAYDLVTQFGGTAHCVDVEDSPIAAEQNRREEQAKADGREYAMSLLRKWLADPSNAWDLPLLVYPSHEECKCYFKWLEGFVPAMREAWGIASHPGSKEQVRGPFPDKVLFEEFDNASLFNQEGLQFMQDVVIDQANNGKNAGMRTWVLLHEDMAFEKRYLKIAKIMVYMGFNVRVNLRTAQFFEWNDTKDKQLPMTTVLDVTLTNKQFMLAWTQRRR